jgi:F-type H+-transporting ATPase subunit b
VNLLPDLSVLWVIFFVLLLATILNSLLFKPLMRVMEQRQAAASSARQLAEQAAARAKAATDEFEAKTREARADVYRQMEEARHAALDRRAALMSDTRQQAEAAIAEASARLRAEADEARARLDRDAESLATTIVERVLGRHAS